VLFAVPMASPLLCPAVEAELIGQVSEAGVVDVISNAAAETRHRGADDVHVEPAVQKIRDDLHLLLGSDIFTPADVAEPQSTKIRDDLHLLLGSDIFTPADVAEPQSTDAPIARSLPLAREYKGDASDSRPRTPDDPPEATHGRVGAGIPAWGRFEADEPDKRFRVIQGSRWRRAILNPEAATFGVYVKVNALQDDLVAAGLLEETNMSFPHDHVFDNWTIATRVISGKATYSGGYHWQLLTDPDDSV
jgi:hypothetical protein